ncbi:heme biosynthesis protein HemY [Ancylobacter terrae]|uniref:heme biosynthesis protein HemY n=1 Tax=Ancylobacter sp. sgz301288 TaxID=3342077 RepID=UPI00385C6958
MIRLVVYLLALAALAFGIAWLADRPGEITILWQGWRIETSVMVAAAALLATIALAIVLWSVLRLILRSPDIVGLALRNRRRTKGWNAVSRGLVAVGTGDVSGARRAASDAERLLGNEPVARLLAAQAAQLAGDVGGAEAAFRAMASTPATRLLGLRGLHVEARRRGDTATALMTAEEAVRQDPSLVWAADAVIEARCAAGDYASALGVLEREAAHGGLDRALHRRRRAVLLAAQAQALEASDPARARERAVEAVRLAPTLVPAAAIAGRLLAANGDPRKAAKILETAFAATPHPELAEAFLHVRPGDAARERLKRVRTLSARAPAHPESGMVLARAALDAQEFAEARAALAPLTELPTQRVCLLMAELEAAEHGDVGKAREWSSRAVRADRDPVWIADGVVAEQWGPVSPVTGRLDAFHWAVPPGATATPLIEHEVERARLAIAAAIEAHPAPVDKPSSAKPAAAAEPKAAPAPQPGAVNGAAAPIRSAPVSPNPAPIRTAPASSNPVTAKPARNPAPLVPEPQPARNTMPPLSSAPVVATPHLPDDPGPELASEDLPPAHSKPPFAV